MKNETTCNGTCEICDCKRITESTNPQIHKNELHQTPNRIFRENCKRSFVKSNTH